MLKYISYMSRVEIIPAPNVLSTYSTLPSPSDPTNTWDKYQYAKYQRLDHRPDVLITSQFLRIPKRPMVRPPRKLSRTLYNRRNVISGSRALCGVKGIVRNNPRHYYMVRNERSCDARSEGYSRGTYASEYEPRTNRSEFNTATKCQM